MIAFTGFVSAGRDVVTGVGGTDRAADRTRREGPAGRGCRIRRKDASRPTLPTTGGMSTNDSRRSSGLVWSAHARTSPYVRRTMDAVGGRDHRGRRPARPVPFRDGQADSVRGYRGQMVILTTVIFAIKLSKPYGSGGTTRLVDRSIGRWPGGEWRVPSWICRRWTDSGRVPKRPFRRPALNCGPFAVKPPHEILFLLHARLKKSLNKLSRLRTASRRGRRTSCPEKIGDDDDLSRKLTVSQSDLDS